MTLHLKAHEGDALRIAELLVGHGRAGALPPSIDIENPSPALVEAVARTLAAGCMQLLLHSGGARERSVLRQGKRKVGRLWDPELNELFDMELTRSARNFWVSAVRDLVPLAHRKREGDLTREDRRVVKQAAPAPYAGVGDLVFFALAHEHAQALHLPLILEEALKQELRRASPLALLFGADDAVLDETGVRDSLRQLLAPGPLRVIECIDDALVETWLNKFRLILLHSHDRQVFLGRMRAFARTLRVWVQLLDEARRADLTRSVVRFLARWPRRSFPTGLDLRNHALRLPGTASMSERDEALRAMGEIAELRTLIDGIRQRLGEERYGDDRYGEGQIVARMIEEELVPHRDSIEALARTLSGAVG